MAAIILTASQITSLKSVADNQPPNAEFSIEKTNASGIGSTLIVKVLQPTQVTVMKEIAEFDLTDYTTW